MTTTDTVLLVAGVGAAVAAFVYWNRSAPPSPVAVGGTTAGIGSGLVLAPKVNPNVNVPAKGYFGGDVPGMFT